MVLPDPSPLLLTLAASTSFRVPERWMALMGQRLAPALRSHSTRAPELQQMLRTVSPPRPAGHRAPGTLKQMGLHTGASARDGVETTADAGPGARGAAVPIILLTALCGTQSCSDTGALSATIWCTAAFTRHTWTGEPEMSSAASSPSSSSSTSMRAPVSCRSCGPPPQPGCRSLGLAVSWACPGHPRHHAPSGWWLPSGR